ncbi:MAG: LysR family transcriptional regulator [Kiloniellales bacterium]|nr:LysR family transcriptional regulator [Kiloniellales bacterium]
MNIDHIRTFLEVAATGNFNRAAESLNVTQSTVSARIRVLEEQLDRRLFARNRYGVTLTPAGQHFRHHAEISVRAWLRAKQEVALPDDVTGVLGIGASVTVYDRLFPDWLSKVRAKAPTVALRIEIDFSQGLNRRLADGAIDVAVMYQPRTAPGIRIEKLFEDDLVLIASEDRETAPEGRSDYVHVDWGFDFNSAYSEAFPDTDGPAVSVGMEDIALNHILRHGGAAYLSLRSTEPFLEQRRLFKVRGAPAFKRPTYVAYTEDSTDGALLDLAMAELRAIVAAGPQAT